MSNSIQETKKDWIKGDIVQITNENHPWFPALVIVTKAHFYGVEGYVFVFDEHCPQNNVARGTFKAADIEFVGRAQFVLLEKKPVLIQQFLGLEK